MPIYQFEAMDATGNEFKDEIEAPTEEEAKTTIRQMGYFITRMSLGKRNVEVGERVVEPLKPKTRDKIDFKEASSIFLKCIVAFMCATLLFELAKTGVFNHYLFIEAVLLAIYNKVGKT